MTLISRVEEIIISRGYVVHFRVNIFCVLRGKLSVSCLVSKLLLQLACAVGPNFIAVSLVIQLDGGCGKMCCHADNSLCSKIVCHLGFFLVVEMLLGQLVTN